MYYDPFVLPFTIGLTALLLFLIIKYIRWIRTFRKSERRKIRKGIFSLKTLRSIGEIFSECLLHRKIYRTNPFLGYMHTCFGLGWFLLIVAGKTESMVYHTSAVNPPYFAIFFRFFHPAKETFPYSNTFAFITDLLLLFILSGLFLALAKRLWSRIVGMRKTTKHRPLDLLILTTLWLIFPLRFLAESFTSGLRGGGSFLTNNAGEFFARFLPLEQLTYPAWWAYSGVLGLFFILLPFSRYMHIPTEIVYIFLKNWGIKQGTKFNAFSEIQMYACSRCGICIDSCQLNSSLGMDTQPVYFLKKIRHQKEYGHLIENCLLCGRCEASCPVGLTHNALRLAKRPDLSRITKNTYSYAKNAAAPAKMAYFAGCMGQLTPAVTRSMEQLFKQAGVSYTFIDKEGGVCCGRPMLLAGNREEAAVMAEKNRAILKASGAEVLVTSCPICLKMFREEYGLQIRIVHHTEYIDELIREGKLKTVPSEQRTVFHNPCELGRGSGIYQAPENILKSISRKIDTAFDGKKSLCCGGSLANTSIDGKQRNRIAGDAAKAYAAYKPDVLVTACPLCKKTFATASDIPVKDIAEVVAERCRP